MNYLRKTEGCTMSDRIRYEDIKKEMNTYSELEYKVMWENMEKPFRKR